MGKFLKIDLGLIEDMQFNKENLIIIQLIVNLCEISFNITFLAFIVTVHKDSPECGHVDEYLIILQTQFLFHAVGACEKDRIAGIALKQNLTRIDLFNHVGIKHPFHHVIVWI